MKIPALLAEPPMSRPGFESALAPTCGAVIWLRLGIDQPPRSFATGCDTAAGIVLAEAAIQITCDPYGEPTRAQALQSIDMNRTHALKENGAGEGNRTLVVGLGSRCITTMLHPHAHSRSD